MISFAIGELRVGSLQDVLDMSWAEFRLRLFAYKRIEKNRLYELREVMWTTLIAPHYNPKKLPKTRESFMPLEKKKNISEEAKKAFFKAREDYLKKRNNG